MQDKKIVVLDYVIGLFGIAHVLSITQVLSPISWMISYCNAVKISLYDVIYTL